MNNQKAQSVEEMAKSYFGIKSLRRHNDELSYIDGFKDAVQWQQSQSKWIPCSERLPDIEEDVWIWFNDRPYRAHLMTQSDIDFHGFKSGIYWDDTELFRPITGVIYWQPYILPQPPKI